MYNDQNNVTIIGANEATPAFDGETTVTGAYRTAALSKGEMDGSLSSQWYSRPDDERFTSLSELRNAVAERSRNSHAINIDPSQIRVDVEKNGFSLELPNGDNPNMTHWSFGQLCTMTRCPAEYMRRLPEKLAGINLQHGLMDYNGEYMKAFVHDGENGQSLRALTGRNYGRIHDFTVVDEVMKIAGNGTGDTRWKVPGVLDWRSDNGVTMEYNPFVDVTKENTTLYASDRDVYLFLVDDTHPIEVGKLPNGEPDLMFRGFIVWNSETGAKSFGMTTMLLRGVCANRNIWGVGESREIRIRHSRLAPSRFAYEAAPFLTTYANASTAGVVSKVQNAKAAIIATNDDERREFLTSKKIGVSKTMADKVLETVLREEQKPMESIWDVVQGLTAVARKIPHQDARLDMEMKAGKLMDRIAA